MRPRKTKTVRFDPKVVYFKPQGVPLRDLEEVALTVDELEALRLSNVEQLSQIDGALRMGVHQSTFQRTLARAREKITLALVEGKAIKIGGGDFKFTKKTFGVCVCPSCGYEKPHERGQPCRLETCIHCNNHLTKS